MVFQRDTVLATLPGPMQQPNDKYEEKKSTPSQIPEQICKKIKNKNAKKSIHLVQLLSNNCNIDFQFHFKASFCSKMLIYSHSYTEKGHHCLFAWTIIVIQAEGLALREKGRSRQTIYPTARQSVVCAWVQKCVRWCRKRTSKFKDCRHREIPQCEGFLNLGNTTQAVLVTT